MKILLSSIFALGMIGEVEVEDKNPLKNSRNYKVSLSKRNPSGSGSGFFKTKTTKARNYKMPQTKTESNTLQTSANVKNAAESLKNRNYKN
jgi:predicted glutamine amidotransferase